MIDSGRNSRMGAKINKDRGVAFVILARTVLIGLIWMAWVICPVCADEPGFGYYEVRSNVENASVFFNGEFAGNIRQGTLMIPARISDRPVRHELMIEAPGFATYNETVIQAPKEGRNIILRGTLTRLPAPRTGTLNLAISPPGPEVFIDGVSRGIVDQSGIIVLRDIEAGFRSLLIRFAGYEDYHERVFVEDNMITRVRINLVPVTTGFLQVTSTPAGATILINGVPAGITPVILSEMPEGEVELRLTLAGYYDWTAVTSVIPGQTVPVSGALVPVPVSTPTLEPEPEIPEPIPEQEPIETPLYPAVAVLALFLGAIGLKKR